MHTRWEKSLQYAWHSSVGWSQCATGGMNFISLLQPDPHSTQISTPRPMLSSQLLRHPPLPCLTLLSQKQATPKSAHHFNKLRGLSKGMLQATEGHRGGRETKKELGKAKRSPWLMSRESCCNSSWVGVCKEKNQQVLFSGVTRKVRRWVRSQWGKRQILETFR